MDNIAYKLTLKDLSCLLLSCRYTYKPTYFIKQTWTAFHKVQIFTDKIFVIVSADYLPHVKSGKKKVLGTLPFSFITSYHAL
jgi:hypothetical protein